MAWEGLVVPSLTAIQSLLVYGAVLPPLTPWQGRLRGQVSDAYGSALATSREVFVDLRPTPASGDEMRSTATEFLDAELTAALASGRRPLVLFSGGVDSALMAARLRVLGYDDTLLVHYQFNKHDDETPTARKMAKALGLELEVIERDDSGLSLLDQPGQTYPVPFGDLSALPTYELCAGLGRLVDPSEFVVFDGNGADGAFGLGGKISSLRKLVGLPSAALGVGSRAYALHGWQMRGSWEYRMRVARRLSRLSPAGAVLAQNSLFDILYRAPDLAEIDAGWNRILEQVVGRDLSDQVVLSDQAVTHPGTFAQKNLGPLEAQGFEVSYPFLTSDLVSLGLSHTAAFPATEAKAWMKQELAQHLPVELVYRPKRGFVEPEMTVFDTSEFQEHLEDALSGGVVNELLDLTNIRRMLNDTDRLGSLPHGHLNFLWVTIFTNRWFKTVG